MAIFEVLQAKRDGRPLDGKQIRWVLEQYTAGAIPDYQMSALLMAIFINGLDSHELAIWTEGMLHSGEVMDFGDIPGVKVDKHSTGGVGDKISICLAPLVGACGVRIPMVSGRGLGHTGGTLDKLESIPGFCVDVTDERFRELVADVGVALIGQTREIAPADRKLYALRDVTATVASVPLIASSIMSKKLAEGIDGLVLDVKVGSGAFMKTEADARVLAETLVGIGTRMGKRVTALMTSMQQPIGGAVGNAIEVEEAIAVLRGEGPEDTTELTLALGAEMLVLAGIAESDAPARERLQQAIADGSGLDKLKQIVQAQGGDPAAIDDPGRLPRAPHRTEFTSRFEGVLAAIDAEDIGRAALALGAGRRTKEDAIDPGVGLRVKKRIGDTVEQGEPLVEILYSREDTLGECRQKLAEAFVIGGVEVAPPRLLIGRTRGGEGG